MLSVRIDAERSSSLMKCFSEFLDKNLYKSSIIRMELIFTFVALIKKVMRQFVYYFKKSLRFLEHWQRVKEKNKKFSGNYYLLEDHIITGAIINEYYPRLIAVCHHINEIAEEARLTVLKQDEEETSFALHIQFERDNSMIYAATKLIDRMCLITNTNIVQC